jgi:hypothetical protein
VGEQNTAIVKAKLPFEIYQAEKARFRNMKIDDIDVIALEMIVTCSDGLKKRIAIFSPKQRGVLIIANLMMRTFDFMKEDKKTNEDNQS